MALNLAVWQKNKQSLLINTAFYLFSAFLILLLFSYFALAYKEYLQNQKINDVEGRIAFLNSGQQKSYENKVLDYKKKIDEYGVIVANHRIYSNLFNFIEEKTLPQVWFSGFNISQSSNDVKLPGEAENMDVMMRQVQIFEESNDYVKDVTVLNSETETSGKIKFTADIVLNPKVFGYVP